MEPTKETYSELQMAYDHFNRSLFDGKLPACLITLQRKKHVCGYFSAKRFVNSDGVLTDEIAMNPEFFSFPILQPLQTLVHEMAHLWQSHFGKPGRARYHNQEWASRMEAMGLMPSSTGQPGGAKTGDQMSDYPIPGGRFEAAVSRLLTEAFTLSWADRFRPEAPGLESLLAGLLAGAASEHVELRTKVDRSNRLKYHCPLCCAQVWGKPGLKIRCGECLPEPLFEVWGVG